MLSLACKSPTAPPREPRRSTGRRVDGDGGVGAGEVPLGGKKRTWR